MTNTKPYLRLASDDANPGRDAALELRITADESSGEGQGTVSAAIEQYEGQATYFLDLDGDGVDGDEMSDLAVVEALGRALIAAARKARVAQRGSRRPRRPKPPTVVP